VHCCKVQCCTVCVLSACVVCFPFLFLAGLAQSFELQASRPRYGPVCRPASHVQGEFRLLSITVRGRHEGTDECSVFSGSRGLVLKSYVGPLILRTMFMATHVTLSRGAEVRNWTVLP